MADSSTKSACAVLALGLLLTLCGAALFGVAALSYETLRAFADSVAMYGSADVYTRAFHDAMRLRLFLGGAFFLASGIALVAARGPLGNRLASLWNELREQAAALLGDARAAWQSEPLTHRRALVLITLTGAGLRAMYLGYPMRGDEAYTYNNYISAPLAVLLSNYGEPNNHVLHSLLAKGCVLLFGDSPPAIRLVAFAAGVLVIPASWLATRMLYRERSAALVAAALVAASSELVKFSANARGYMLVALFFLLLFALAPRLVDRPGERLGWILFAALGALGMFAIPIMVFPFGAVCCWTGIELLRTRRDLSAATRIKPLIVAGLATIALTGLFYAPVFMGTGFESLFSNPWITGKTSPRTHLSLLERLGVLWAVWNMALPGLMYLPLLALTALAAALHFRLGRGLLGPLLVTLFWTALLATLRGNDPPVRTLLFALPLYCMALASLVGQAARRLQERYAMILCVALAVIGAAGTVNSRAVLRSGETGVVWDFPAIARYLGEEMRQGDRLIGGGVALPALTYEAGRSEIVLPPLGQPPAQPRRILHLLDAGAQPPPGTSARLLKEFPSFQPSEIWAYEPVTSPAVP